VPKPFPAKFRRDLSPWPQGETSIAQIARDLGISESDRPAD
jgi:hypothetical protein